MKEMGDLDSHRPSFPIRLPQRMYERGKNTAGLASWEEVLVEHSDLLFLK